MEKLIVFIFVLVGGSIGYNNFTTFFNFVTNGSIGGGFINNDWFGMVVGALIGYVIGVFVVDPILNALKIGRAHV